MILSTVRTTTFILIFLAVCFSTRNINAECIDGDCVNGQGTYIWPNGDTYVGEWKDGKRNGEGSLIWPEGDRYVGVWKNDKNNGHGDYFYPAAGKQYFVEFSNAEAVEFGCIKGDCINGIGTYTWLSGAKYVGDFENGERNGLGIYSFPNGHRVLGIWDNGKYVGKEKPQQSQWRG